MHKVDKELIQLKFLEILLIKELYASFSLIAVDFIIEVLHLLKELFVGALKFSIFFGFVWHFHSFSCIQNLT